MKIIKTEKYAQGVVNPLDGKSNQQARSLVQKIIPYDKIKGIFKDDYWQGPKFIFEAFNDYNLNWFVEDSRYYPTFDGNPMGGKIWDISINFVNNKGKESRLYCKVTAAGAGTVQDPLSKYDVVVNVN